MGCAMSRSVGGGCKCLMHRKAGSATVCERLVNAAALRRHLKTTAWWPLSRRHPRDKKVLADAIWPTGCKRHDRVNRCSQGRGQRPCSSERSSQSVEAIWIEHVSIRLCARRLHEWRVALVSPVVSVTIFRCRALSVGLVQVGRLPTRVTAPPIAAPMTAPMVIITNLSPQSPFKAAINPIAVPAAMNPEKITFRIWQPLPLESLLISRTFATPSTLTPTERPQPWRLASGSAPQRVQRSFATDARTSGRCR